MAKSINSAVMQILVDSGAEIDNVDGGGDTALHQAAENGHVEAVKVSYSFHHLSVLQGQSFQMWGIIYWLKIVHVLQQTLLDLGADKSIPDEGGATAAEEICEDTPSCSEEVKETLKSLLS